MTAAVSIAEVVDMGMMVLTVSEVRNIAQDVRLESLRAYAVSSDRREQKARQRGHTSCAWVVPRVRYMQLGRETQRAGSGVSNSRAR